SVVTEMTFQCTGKKLGAALISSMRNGIFLIPALFILSDVRGLSGIQEAQPLAFALTFAAAIFFFVWYMKKLPREDREAL
ncbi:MAG: MATE family efflux transporter, partial [Firmicutes bacterium]|nr:MATE family efflux transporter [Bacillota bacterium]